MQWQIALIKVRKNLGKVKIGLSLFSAYKNGNIELTILPSLGLTSWSNKALAPNGKEVNNKL